jgi:hypothetical protein
MKKFTLLLLFILPILLSSCYIQHFNAGEVPNEICMNEPSGRNDKWVSMGTFEFKDQAQYVFFSLFAVHKVEVAEIVKQEMTKRNGDGVINLTIETRFEPLDALLQVVSVFYGQRTVFIKREIIKRK